MYFDSQESFEKHSLLGKLDRQAKFNNSDPTHFDLVAFLDPSNTDWYPQLLEKLINK
jgi:hypothetical protein